MANVGRPTLNWSAAIRPLLAGYGTSFNKNDIAALAKSIIDSANDILIHDAEHELFYSSFVSLAAYYFTASASNIPKSHSQSVIGAVRVLLKYLLQRLAKHPIIETPKNIMELIEGLCRGSVTLPKSVVLLFVARLRTEKAPPNVKQDAIELEEVESKEVKRPRLDTGNDIFDQLTSVFTDALPKRLMTARRRQLAGEVSSTDADTTTPSHLTDAVEDAKMQFGRKAIAVLAQLDGSDILLDVCSRLTFLGRYIKQCTEAMTSSTPALVMPVTLSEALTTRNSYSSVLNDITVVWKAFSLPILEPLTPARLSKVVNLMLSCLYTALAVAVSNTIVNLASSIPAKAVTAPKDEELDSLAACIVQKALEIYHFTVSSLRKSTRAGGNHLQTMNLQASWLLLKGLQIILCLTPASILERSKDSTKIKAQPAEQGQVKPREISTSKPGFGKSFQGFGVLSVALASHTVQLLTSLLNDFQIEGVDRETMSVGGEKLTEMQLSGSYTAWDRLSVLMSEVNVTDITLTTVMVALKKATLLKRQKEGSETSESSTSSSDSNTYYEDDFSSSSESSSDDDDDSEPILGQWFEETLSPEEPADTTEPTPPAVAEIPEEQPDAGGIKRSGQNGDGEYPNFISDKREPDGFVNLAVDMLNFLNTYVVSLSDVELQQFFKNPLSDEHMFSLSAIIRELDRECLRPGADKVYEELSTSLANFTHSLIASGTLSDQLQENLLSNLGVSTSSVDPWPLTSYPRTLAVLAEVILLKQQREREAKITKCQSETAIISIWIQFLTSLKSAILYKSDSKVEISEDVNVEHLQLLLFFFHSLPLMQKRALLHRLAQNIISVANIDTSDLETMVPLALSRMMLIFDYLIRHFYDPPQTLIEQVQYNLFVVHTLHQNREAEDAFSKAPHFFPCREVEENFRKNLTPKEVTEIGVFNPRFYNLGPSDINTQDTPKIDGLAGSFLLATSDVVNYNQLYDACVTLLMAGSACDKTTEKLSLLAGSSMHYHFLIVWRLLSVLPPSVDYLRLLESGEVEMRSAMLLHTLRWAPRLGHKVFTGWIRDSLVKQGQTTRDAKTLLTNAEKSSNNVQYDIKLSMNFIKEQIAALPIVSGREILPADALPGFASILMLEGVTSKLQVALDETFTNAMADTDPHKTMDIAQVLRPALLFLTEAYFHFGRSCILNQLMMSSLNPATGNSSDSDTEYPTIAQLNAYSAALSIGANRPTKITVLATFVMGSLPLAVREAVEKWNAASAQNEFPSVGGWRNAFANDILPCESYMDAIHNAHIASLSGQANYQINGSLRHCLNALVRFVHQLVKWCPDDNTGDDVVNALFPMVFDASTEYLSDTISVSLERFLGAVDATEFQQKMYYHVFNVCHELIIKHSLEETGLSEKIFQDCLTFMENHIVKPPAKKAFEQLYSNSADLSSILLSAARDKNMSVGFGNKVLRFFNKLFHLSDKQTASDKSYEVLCSTLANLASVDKIILRTWISKMIIDSASEQSLENADDMEAKLQENRGLLQNFTTYIVKEKNHAAEDVANNILASLIPMGTDILTSSNNMAAFPEMMAVMTTLAGAGKGAGHQQLFEAATGWVKVCKGNMSDTEVAEKLREHIKSGKNEPLMEAVCVLLSYIGEILTALKHTTDRSSSPAFDSDLPLNQQDIDSDWAEDLAQDEDDSAADDSDDESLNSKLCTFTITQKEFMNQHWYHCHTCEMVDGVGVCTICAKVCHKDHDLTYAKFGSFFCDCGAKEDGSCLALVKRTPQSGLNTSEAASSASPFSIDSLLPSLLRRRMSSPGSTTTGTTIANKPILQIEAGPTTSIGPVTEVSVKSRQDLTKQIPIFRESLIEIVEKTGVIHDVLELLQVISPQIMDMYQCESLLGSAGRAQKALTDLHTLDKTIDNTDQLVTVTLSSQEGAFENVRMNYSGDQGQTIRQLITAHMLRRVAMCVLSSTQGKRQHLAISHEKGKITILQLSALLKQADSNKKKLTLTRLASVPIPFTILSMSGNPCNEDFLAVTGLKDCHVLTFANSGSVANHMVLQPALTTGNFIIKAIWLPGSQTELAVVTADFVKIYDLAVDEISPKYYFLLPSGKIRDATFIFMELKGSLVLMASSGYIYIQPMEDESSAEHGPFYITNVLEVNHTELKDTNGQVAGGGVSVYYSHLLMLLFFSYTQGKSFVGVVASDLSSMSKLIAITFKSGTNGGSGKNSSPAAQPLVQWSEVLGHPGLLYCRAQTSGSPVVLMMKPETVMIQEIKVIPAKAKIQDVVAIRHVAAGTDQPRTTLIILCEDGSLRIYLANPEQASFWLSSVTQPQTSAQVMKPTKKKKQTKAGRAVGSLTFPTDFFEHCQQTNDVEFGGNDLLQIYNTQQVKHRLNTSGLYVASTRTAGFTLEITNTNNTAVMVGLRVQVGTERTPSYLEVFGRTKPVSGTDSRWYDLAFTREESLTADKKCTLFVGASVDPSGVTMLSSVKVYVKTKEAFGWPEETDEFVETTTTSSPKKTVPTTSSVSAAEVESQISAPLPLTSSDRLLTSALEVLDGAFSATDTAEQKSDHDAALNLSTQLLSLPTPQPVQQHTKSLMASLFNNKTAYHTYKDGALLTHVTDSLAKNGANLDIEAFQHLVVTARSVAIARPMNLLKYAERGDDTPITSPDEPKAMPRPSLAKVHPHHTRVGIDRSLNSLTINFQKTTDKDLQMPCMPLSPMSDDSIGPQQHFIDQLMTMFWGLHNQKPENLNTAPIGVAGLNHIEATVTALVDIIYAFTLADLDHVTLAMKHYVQMLLCSNVSVSFACKQGLIRTLRPKHKRRRVFIPSPPRCQSPGGAEGGEDDDDDADDDVGGGHRTMPQPTMLLGHGLPSIDADPEDQFEVVENNEPLVLEPSENGAPSGRSPLEALLSGGNFPPMVDIPPDADDETMVELAIALSLQEQMHPLAHAVFQAGGGGAPLSLQEFALSSQAQSMASLEGGHLSDTTASAPGSDDEVGSNAATDGSTLRTSPAEHGGSAGSESGGSNVDSVSVSGRSSAYGDAPTEGGHMGGGRSDLSSLGVHSSSTHHELEGRELDGDLHITGRLHSLRLMLLEKLVQYLPNLRNVTGVQCIPFMQVLMMLTSDLDGDEERDRTALDNLLHTLITELNMADKDVSATATRSSSNEVKLVLLRFLSVLLSRAKTTSKPSIESSTYLSTSTATALLSRNAVDFCLSLLQELLKCWKQAPLQEEEVSGTESQLLKPRPNSPAPDMSPYFLRQYVKSHVSDVFEDYPQLLTEMVLRLPYQMKKISDAVASVPDAVFSDVWFNILSEYMMASQTSFVKRQVRKLLLFICGTKENYRQLRDLHALKTHMAAVMDICQKGGLQKDGSMVQGAITLPYDTLLALIEQLKACSDVATTRSLNWQMLCQKDTAILPFLIKASIALDEGIAPVILQLLQCAICGTKTSESASGLATSTPNPKLKKEKDKDKPEDPGTDDALKTEEDICTELVQQLTQMDDKDIVKFISAFLLVSNSTNIRWQAHSLIYNIYKNSTAVQQESLLGLLWKLWQDLPRYGRKAAQFVDLLGYFMLKTPQIPEKQNHDFLDKAIKLLENENKILANHPNATIYNLLQGLVDFDGYYLESDPCLVCNNPEVAFTNLKLTAVKVDSKFTTTTQIVKLAGSHVISKISLRISDLKRSKMVRVMNVYYNNRAVQAVVELKNKPGLWNKAKKVSLTAGQTEVKVDFPIHIVACNLMIEYSEFYDNIQATSETLQCPRCSASVPANPGVCGNCGENVFQCHKCRSINYDEKDPFLCNACGFCKYAKFDLTLNAKPCCAVDPIENEEDRKKAITTINSLLEKADRLYKQLQMHRPSMEMLLVQVTEHSVDRSMEDIGVGVPGSNVNKAIQLLAQKYCNESKTAFDELSKIIQKILSCRKELVEYDSQQQENAWGAASLMRNTCSGEQLAQELMSAPRPKPDATSPVKASTCYGCASATVEHCITLLRALATNVNIRQALCSQGMIHELITYNLRRGTLGVRAEVRSLLCLLTKDNRRATDEMNEQILSRMVNVIQNHVANPDLASSVRHEMQLLAESVRREDTCWEHRVRCVMYLFLMGMESNSPLILDNISLPCLRILQDVVTPDITTAVAVATDAIHTGPDITMTTITAAAAIKKIKERKAAELLTTSSRNLEHVPAELHVRTQAWLMGDKRYSFQAWRQRMPGKGGFENAPAKKASTGSTTDNKALDKRETSEYYLMEKYGYRWLQRMWKVEGVEVKLTKTSWLQQALFIPSSRSARATACQIILSMCQVPSRKKEIVNLLTSFLDDMGQMGEWAAEYLALYKRLIAPVHWKYYLALRGILPHIGDLLIQEVEYLEELEQTTLNSDLSQGFTLKSLTELMAMFVEDERIKQHYKNKLVGYVLNGYLSLKKLVIQRTKLIDETQTKLLELLEELTTGTESETKEFMSVCIQTVKRYPLTDYRSPVFIFERLCSIIYPEENDIGEIFLILEKDPQQEDFLQGRMLGNPYSSNEPGLGPLMRDVKNKICQDCELVALLEDDTGMELLVNKKIISLDLPVKEVYKKIWSPEHGEGEPMPIIYRMRGLLGDATEDMVNSLDTSTDEDVDKEEVYKMAKVLSDCGGLEVILQRLASIKDLVVGKQLMTVLLKLFSYSVNIKANRQQLIKPQMNAIATMLRALNLALLAEQEVSSSGTQGQTITEQILHIMDIILMEASGQSPDKYKEFSKHFGDRDQLKMLLGRINSAFVRNNTNVLQALMRLIPFLAFGEEQMMQALINHFKTYLDFNSFDDEHTQDDQVHLDSFCVIASGIEHNENGHRLKSLIVENGIVQTAVEYIGEHAPEIKTLLATDSDNWKEFVSKPALKYVLRLVTGLVAKHVPSQTLVNKDCIRILHKLEQVSSDEHVGTLAENLLEALRGNADVAATIEEIRQQTKAEKKRLAMAVRKKQLGALGMTTNEKGQVTVKSSVLRQMEDIKEETGLTCCICREGYRNQPQKVLGIYTYTKRVNLDDFECKPRKTQGYSTVTHFNLVHVDCHMAAVRHARGREEWESAALQNANTRCNGLMPLWGPQVQESAFATCLARHNSYLQESTGMHDVSYSYTVHDLKHLLIRFSQERSFSEESGGGGRQSNMYLVFYMMHMALYVINTTRTASREEKNLNLFLEAVKEKWLDNCFETDSPLYWATMTMHIWSVTKWRENRMTFLRRLLIMAQARHISPGGCKSLWDKSVKAYSVYKSALVMFGQINTLYEKILKKVKAEGESSWSQSLADYIRNNDRLLIDASDRTLAIYEEELLPCESFGEFCDVIGLLEEIPDPDIMLMETLASVP